MHYHVQAPRELKATIQLPASKSISNRVLVLNELTPDPQPLSNLAVCDDTDVMVAALQRDHGLIDIQAAGTAMRFLTALLSLKEGEWVLTGTERMRNRPIALLVDALRDLGAEIRYREKEGFPPLEISGHRMKGGAISLESCISSQYISALLMIAPLMEQGLTLTLVGETISKPYIYLTIQLMRQFGVTVEVEKETFRVQPQSYRARPFTVESDWSAASYWYEMVALSERGEVTLKGLFRDSLQGDAAVATLFQQLGVSTQFSDSGVTLRKSDEPLPTSLVYDFIDIPDLAPTLAVTCVMLEIPFLFTGLQSLKIKESDRLTAIQTELRKFGYLLEIEDDRILKWKGARCQPASSPWVRTYDDHRLAMAFAPIALGLSQGIQIASGEVVTKSYPHYWSDLQKAGFLLTARSIEDEAGEKAL